MYENRRTVSRHLKRFTLLTLLVLASAAHAQKPRVALLLSDDGRHHDEFDSALTALGWSADRYPCNAENMKSLVGKLGDYDMLIAAPLFNLTKEPVLPGKAREAYMRFLENGGLIAVTDGSYPGARAWLADIHPAFGGLETGNCNSSQWGVNGVTTDAEPPHPLRFFPSHISEPNSWPHFLKPAKDTQWRLVANCSEGFPVTFAQTVGKGTVSLSALRQPSAKQLGNLYACLQLSRAGLALKSFEMPYPAVGAGNLRLEFAGSGATEPCGFAYEVVPENGQTQRFEKVASGATFELPYRIALRGPVTARLLLKRGGQETLLFSRRAVLPPLLTVTPNAYRGLLSTARRLPAVTFGIRLVPDQEKLEGATVGLTVLGPGGSKVAVTNTTLAADSATLVYGQPMLLDPSLPAGSYTVRAALVSGTKTLAVSEAPFKILSPLPAQTVIDEDNTLLVNGKPFFPLGLYHVSPSNYTDVASLGINTVQFWTWDDQRGLDLAAAHGLKAIFELNHKSEQIVRDVVAKFGANPEVLMWYGLDEPAEGSYGLAETMRDAFHACDDQHPVYAVSCRPDAFAEQAAFTDVFAHDPYGKPQKAVEWMTQSVAAVENRKPVICVPGVFGKETAEELRATAYLALAHDARGVIWYPWNQMGGGPLGAGLKNSPEQQAVIKQLCSEINALEPALTAPVRYPFASNDGKLHGILCAKLPQRILLLVNNTPEKINAEAGIPGAENVSNEFRDFFKKRDESLYVRSGKFRIALEPYETRVYGCE